MSWTTRADQLVPAFVAPIRDKQVIEALERLEEWTNNETTRRYVESLRLAIERTQLLAATEKAGADHAHRSAK